MKQRTKHWNASIHFPCTHWTHAVNPLIMCAYLMSTRSSQPHRLFLPVVTPTSFPRVWRSSPISWRQQGEHRHSWVSGVHKVRRFFFEVYLERRFNKFVSQCFSFSNEQGLLGDSQTNELSVLPLLLCRSEAKPPLGGVVWKESNLPAAHKVSAQIRELFVCYKAVYVTLCILLRCSALRGRRRCRLWLCTPWRPRKPRRRSEGACPVLCTRHPLCSWTKSQTGTSLQWRGIENTKYIL